MLNLPNLRVGGYSTFFDNDLTYFHLGQDVFILLSFIALTWDLLDIYQPSSDSFTSPSGRFHEVSVKTLILYSLALTARLTEYYPFSYFSYDFASCAGFAVIFWIATAFWLYYSFQQQFQREPQQQNNTRDGNLCSPPTVFEGRPVWFHVTVGITAMLAYLYNYSHLTLTPKLFLWAWSHYLDGVAMIPQMYTLVAVAHRGPYSVSPSVWIGTDLMAVSKIFQLMDWAYLWMVADMLDVLAVVSALFYLISFGAFKVIAFIKSRAYKRSINSKENVTAVLTTTGSKPKSPFTATASSASSSSNAYT